MSWLQRGAHRGIASPPSPTGAGAPSSQESPTALGCLSVGFCLVFGDPRLDPTFPGSALCFFCLHCPPLLPRLPGLIRVL